MKLIKLIKTCDACPTQWEGTLEDGRMIYIRYRGGWLSIDVSRDKTKDIFDAVRGETIFIELIDNYLDGSMSYEKLVKLTNHILDYSNIKEA